MEEELYQYHTLGNGIRIVHKQVDGMVAHTGVMINTGSRDEQQEESGLAHFIEHTFFKGTQHRKAYHVISRLDKIGAELNAYTTKEDTMIYASFTKEYYSRTLELLSDIVFNSRFPEHELRKEKEVILDEIDSYKDSPSEKIFDHFEELVYEGHGLGNNILGTKKNIRKFNQKHIRQFLERNYTTDQVVIASVGNISFTRLVKYAEKYFSEIQPSTRKEKRKPFTVYKPSTLTRQLRIYQNHCIVGNIGYSHYDIREKLVLTLLNNILGGPGMNSRLNLSIRERKGWAYHVESNYVPYTDSGLFSVYVSCSNGYLERAINLLFYEMKLLREKKLGPVQLNMAKKQLIGQMALAYESNLNEMMSIARNFMLFGSVESTRQVARSIDSITQNEILEVANQIFDEKQQSILIYKKRKS